ncbi:hypothetical protein JTB14_025519 [Gonioctena quinquepunctata]|nr:hypothetical protein JTB14_025519 [Gonioctena quinquepunctata]
MSSLLVELNGKVDRLLKRNVRVETVNETGILVKANIEFPIGTVAIFENFNLFLKEEENYSVLLNFGVSNLAKAVVDAAEKTNLISNRRETEISIGAWLRRVPERKRRSTILI